MERLKKVEKQIFDKFVKISLINYIYVNFTLNNYDVGINSIKCCSHDEISNQKKENLLLVHGTCGNLTSFAHIIDLLTDRFNIYILDLPGFGQSYAEKNKIVNLSNVEILDFYVNIIKLYIDDVIKPDNNLSCVGFSFGAFIVVEFAHIYNDYFNTLLLFCPVGLFPFGDEYSFYTGALFKLTFPQCILRACGKSFIELFAKFVKYTSSLRLYYDVLLVAENHVYGDVLIGKFIDIDGTITCQNHPLLFKLLSLKCKIGLIYCEKDNIMPVEHGIKITEICNIPLHIIKNAGHSISYTDSTHAVCAIIDAFNRAAIPDYKIKEHHTMDWLLKFKCNFNIFKSRNTMNELYKSI
jgi:pimeloyl-ACP methyl ester carboxylesterase